jgi:hypothetical protein
MYCPACLDHNHTHYWIRHEGPLGPVEAGELIEPCADSFAEGSQLTLSAESTSEQVGQASGIAVGAPQKAGSADAAESSPVPKKASRSFLRGYVGDGDNDEL